ncbi:ABC transporter substrate-binding protein [Halorussus gelatinilyticus]|uniref:ABC transporter substrate-binding protein n=1 Tax=Halorussus gelatinilyticus TaxID=2937524 RepID=A0A8U0IM72_9EURY|nr:ABC transporter substrate-binding protein [Halorussus gelatinilyticus]UPW02240.1 ABC transporter substrate-binding protein [Halorussus gelatinilyticus]
MFDDSSNDATRRRFLKGGTAVGATVLAGCTGGGSGNATTTGETTTETTEETTDETTTQNSSYSVSIDPVGKVTFDAVPQAWVAENPSWADMGVALGMEPPLAVVLTSEYRTHHYDDVPGLSVDTDEMTSLWQDGISKELFYRLGADVHFIDPNYMTNLIPNWKQTDVDEIVSNVGPFCGNTSFSTYPWHSDYPYYDLYEAFEKVAQVFQRTDRYEAFSSLHDEVIGTITDRLPDERPAVALLSPASTEPEKFYPYRLGDRTAYKHWNDLGVEDALAGSDISTFTSDRGTIDYEPLLEIDPEVLLFYTDQHRTPEAFRSTYLDFLRNHDTASTLTAVRNGDVYSAGSMYQGPIMNLSKTERAAKQLFPDEFDCDEKLYDRQRIADIRSGGA